jgi:anti-sigma factor RsiW
MKQHLSEKELAVGIVRGFSPRERQHLADCSQCVAELETFQRTVASFRSSFRELVDAQPARGVLLPTNATKHAHRPIGLWGLAAAMVVMVFAVPAFHDNVVQSRLTEESSADTNPDMLMKSIHAHLSRTVPGPMEPILIFVRNREFDAERSDVR